MERMESVYRLIPVQPKPVCVSLPASKSISNRVLVLDALAGGVGRPGNLAECDDTRVMALALQAAGQREDITVDVGAAGTAMRFLTAYFAARPGLTVRIGGTARLCDRPIGGLVDALRQCGARVRYLSHDGYPPLLVEGSKLRSPGRLQIDGSVSSQFVSAMMMIGPYVEGGLCMALEGNVVSRPYIAMTASLMRAYGGQVTAAGREVVIAEGSYVPPDNFEVEADWTAAGYWYTLKLLWFGSQTVCLRGLQIDSLQGDSRVAEFFRPTGVLTVPCAEGVSLVAGPTGCRRLDLDLSGQPDLAQTLAVAAFCRGIPFTLRGLSTLRVKETDRIAALQAELRKIGCELRELQPGAIEWDGRCGRRSEVGSPCIETYGDHRMAMAFAPAAARFPGLCIASPGVVSKSYPDFWQHLCAAGFHIEEVSREKAAFGLRHK